MTRELYERALKCYAGQVVCARVSELGFDALAPQWITADVTAYVQRWNGFQTTAINETMPADSLLQLYSDYLNTLCRCAEEHHGRVHAVNAECVTVYFGLDSRPDAIADACNCARRCSEAVAALGRRCPQHPTVPGFQVGIDRGPMTIGHCGSVERLFPAAFGRPLDTAAVLSRTPVTSDRGQYGIMFSGAARFELGSDPALVLTQRESVWVKGLLEPVDCYELAVTQE